MDSIEDGATIRIGFKMYYKQIDNVAKDFGCGRYSLKINKKTFLQIGAGTNTDYVDSCIESAIEIAKIMKENCVKKYVIFNGEMVNQHTLKWESCGHIPRDGEELFKKTLEETLNN